MNDLTTRVAFTQWFGSYANLHPQTVLTIEETELQINCQKAGEVIKVAKSIDSIAVSAEPLGIKTIRILYRGESKYALTVRLALIYPLK